MGYRGLFVGLTTLDLIYRVPHLPHANEKQVATELAIAAGGPATNAAVTFRHLGNQAVLMSVIGQNSISELVRADLAEQQVELCDLGPERTEPLPLSSILVTQQTGDRAVVCRNAASLQVDPTTIPKNCLDNIDIVLIDGHQMNVSLAIAQNAHRQDIPVVLDGGSWKPGLENVLPWVDYAICSADFRPPNCVNQPQVMQFLNRALHKNSQPTESPHIAITCGSQPIRYIYQGQSGEIGVSAVDVVDTLGAGDIFHGAFCHHILQTHFVAALHQAAKVAALSCQTFGTRQWLATL